MAETGIRRFTIQNSSKTYILNNFEIQVFDDDIKADKTDSADGDKKNYNMSKYNEFMCNCMIRIIILIVMNHQCSPQTICNKSNSKDLIIFEDRYVI